MIISKEVALRILQEEAEKEINLSIDQFWKERIEKFSKICEGTSKTHIAFLGTALLAKTVDLKTDAYSVKAGDESPGSYSARGLAHSVFVPNAPRLDINLGVTGREPLNNQPYFRIKRVTADIPVHGNAKPAIEALLKLLETVNEISTTKEAREALRAFIHVRRKYSPAYERLKDGEIILTKEKLITAISTFVMENSEGGRRAQAVTAGILDLFAGTERVITGRINDPDRHLPGDIGIRDSENPEQWEKVFEVRDKTVSAEDIYLFAQKAMENGVLEAAVISVHKSQNELNVQKICEWSNARGVSMTFYTGWREFIEQVLFWSKQPQIEGINLIPKLVYHRLIEIEVSELAIKKWVEAFSE